MRETAGAPTARRGRTANASPAAHSASAESAQGPRVLVAGYYGYGNIGDEAILGALLRDIHEVRPDLGFVILSARADAGPVPPGVPVTYASRLNPSKVLAAMRRTQMLILGGGGLIQDVTSLRSLLYYLGLIWTARRLRLPVTIYGGGIGPVTTAAGRRLARAILPQVDLLALRDQLSLDAALSLGVPDAQVALTADPAFSLHRSPDSAGAPGPAALAALAALARAGVPGDRADRLLGWALKAPVSAEDERAFGEAIGRVAAETGLFPVLLPFHPEQDLAMLDRLARVAGTECAVLRDVREPALLQEVVSALTAVVAMRLHGVIFAVAAGVPCVALSYDPKVDALARDVSGLRYVSYPGVDVDELARGVADVLERAPEISSDLAASAALLRARARANATLIAARLP